MLPRNSIPCLSEIVLKLKVAMAFPEASMVSPEASVASPSFPKAIAKAIAAWFLSCFSFVTQLSGRRSRNLYGTRTPYPVTHIAFYKDKDITDYVLSIRWWST